MPIWRLNPGRISAFSQKTIEKSLVLFSKQEFLDLMPIIHEEQIQDAAKRTGRGGVISLAVENLSFAYPDGHPALADVTLK